LDLRQRGSGSLLCAMVSDQIYKGEGWVGHWLDRVSYGLDRVSVASGLARNKCVLDPRRVGSAWDWVGLRSAQARLGLASRPRWARADC
jgi:hypothetical protein